MKYIEIVKLIGLLENSKLKYKVEEYSNGYKVWTDYVSAIQHDYSFGNENGIEIKGGLTWVETTHDIIKYPLTAKEVFKRMMYCEKHKTDKYLKDEGLAEYGLYTNEKLLEAFESANIYFETDDYVKNVFGLLQQNISQLKLEITVKQFDKNNYKGEK